MKKSLKTASSVLMMLMIITSRAILEDALAQQVNMQELNMMLLILIVILITISMLSYHKKFKTIKICLVSTDVEFLDASQSVWHLFLMLYTILLF